MKWDVEEPRAIGSAAGANYAAPKFRLVAFADLRPGGEPAYLVKGLIPRVGLTVAWGPPKCGKSFWTFDLAMHVAMSEQYRGRRVLGGPVVYCAFEGAEGFKARAEAFRLHAGGGAGARFRTPAIPFYLSPSQIDLVADHAALIASIRAHLGDDAPVLVVLDTLNRSLRGSESDDKDMTAYIRAADAICDAFACAVVIVHHCGIDATRPRGHTSLAGAVNAQLAVKRDAADNIIVTVERMKDGPEGDTIISALEVVEVGIDDDGDTITSCMVMPSDAASGQSVQKLSAANRIALDILKKAIADTSTPAPASNHIPPGIRTSTLSLWRSYCEKGTVSKSDKPDSRYKAFVRAVEHLQTRSIIGVWQDHVWIVGQGGQ